MLLSMRNGNVTESKSGRARSGCRKSTPCVIPEQFMYDFVGSYSDRSVVVRSASKKCINEKDMLEHGFQLGSLRKRDHWRTCDVRW